MKSFFFVILSLVVFARADLIDDTCGTTPFSEFCVSSLRSDPHSASAQTSAQLGIVLVDQIDSKAKSTVTKIDTLLSQAQDPKVKGALSSCRTSYTVIINGSVPSSRAALDQGNPKFAEQYMNDAAQATDRCENNFKGLDAPLSGENDFVHKAASDVAAIAKTLE